MDKWEYRKRWTCGFNEMYVMEKMGEDGWELCAIWFFIFYFKRRISNRMSQSN